MSEPRKRKQGERGSRVGADEALTTLVSQFDDPLVFLRELVQNSLDAASTRIDVSFAFEPDNTDDDAKARTKDATGVMTITVEDNGEGMNESIIDRYLLTLFRSTKENDLTKIGKFGVGFVSIFAIAPDLVVLETGQSGESWRLLFHADRSFEKILLDYPVEGTRIDLHKRVAAGEFADLRARGADTVYYWCKYAEAEVCVDGAPTGAAFGLEDDAALAVQHREPGTEIALGLARLRARWSPEIARLTGVGAATALAPVVGFYNRGLTLVEADGWPSREAENLAGISARIKSRYLEHTLTRDNVRQDEHYDKAIELVRARVEADLWPRLRAHLEALAAFHTAGDPGRWKHRSIKAKAHDEGPPPDPGGPALGLALLYARLPWVDARAADRVRLIPTVTGAPVSVQDVRDSDTPLDAALCAPAHNALTAVLAAEGVPVVLDRRSVIEHLAARGVAVLPADPSLYTAAQVDMDAFGAPSAGRAPERGRPGSGHGEVVADWLRRIDAYLDDAKRKVRQVALGDLDYPRSPVAGALCVRQRDAFGVTQLGRDDEATWLGGARALVLNASHPLIRDAARLAVTEPELAAQLVAQAVCVAERGEPRRSAALAKMALSQRRARVRAATAAAKSDAKSGAKSASKSNRKAKR